MTNEEARKILLARINCMERQMTGCCSFNESNCNDYCHLFYKQGTPGKFVNALKKACKTLKRAEGGEE